jgi:hypothetical protein
MAEIKFQDLINLNIVAIKEVAKHIEINCENFNNYFEIYEAIKKKDKELFIPLSNFLNAYYNYQTFYEGVEEKEFKGIEISVEDNQELQDLISNRNKTREVLIKSLQNN